jgi:dTDP-4-dehydrorhamnose 3,5-epimerase
VIFAETALKGAWFVDLQQINDERGFFARSFCQEEFAAHGLKTDVAQSNISFNRLKGTLRGMHFQLPPKAEAKLVRCTRGAVHDVIIDLRPSSATYCQWISVELTGENRRALYIPEGFAHGFQTLEDDSEVFYQMYDFFAPQYASGVRWDDPAFNIEWPLTAPIISDKDLSYDGFTKSVP